MKKQIWILTTLMLAGIFSYAQDTLRTKEKRIACKVLEIGIDEIKYKDFDNLEGPTIVIDKKDVYEIKYQNGKQEIITQDPYEASPEVEIRNKKRAIKFEFFAPLTNKIVFGYETVLKVGTNLECKLGFIWPGLASNAEPADGYFVKAGVKFLLSPNYYVRGVKYAHSLKGGYIKPELIYSFFNQNNTNYYNGAVNICFGKQHILGKIMTLDYYFGIGYGFQSNDLNNTGLGYYNDETWRGYAFSHIYGGPDFPVVLSGGLTLGFLL